MGSAILFFHMDTSKFTTKEDLKKEIKGVKEDIKGVKTELKTDIKTLRSEFKVETKSIRREILRVEEKVENLEEGQKRIEDVLGKMAKTLDGFVGRVDDLTVENEVGTHQIRKLQLQAEDHDKRLVQIESSKQTV